MFSNLLKEIHFLEQVYYFILFTHFLDECILMSDLYGKITQFSSQLKETTDLLLHLGRTETQVENGQSHFEENLGSL